MIVRPMSRLFFYFISVCSVIYLGATATCNFAPTLWCTSKNIASMCGVVDHCEQYVWRKEKDIHLLSLTVYYETLCPDSQDFIIEQLWPTWTRLHQIINLTLVPYGKAAERQTKYGWNFTCQHGPDECIGNEIQTCAIYLESNMTRTVSFILCMEKSHKKPAISYIKCAKQNNMNLSKLKECTHSDHGNQLQHQMAVLTNLLNPPMTFVPWITLNGIHTEKIQEKAIQNLFQLICDTYKGPRPPECL